MGRGDRARHPRGASSHALVWLVASEVFEVHVAESEFVLISTATLGSTRNCVTNSSSSSWNGSPSHYTASSGCPVPCMVVLSAMKTAPGRLGPARAARTSWSPRSVGASAYLGSEFR